MSLQLIDMATPIKDINALHTYSPAGEAGANTYGYVSTSTAITPATATPTGGNLTVLDNSTMIMLYVEDENSRGRFDGTAATASVGDVFPVGRYYLSPAQYKALSIIPESGTAVYHVHQFSN